MNIHQLAGQFLELRAEKDEKRRTIDYDFRNERRYLQNLPGGGFKRLRLLELGEKAQKTEDNFKTLAAELQKVVDQLKPKLEATNINYHDQLEIHIHDQTYSSVWLDENGDIQGLRNYTKL